MMSTRKPPFSIRSWALFVVLMTALSRDGGAQGGPTVVPIDPLIVTRATETVEVTPDRAMITVAVETKEKTAAGAGALNARVQTAVLDTLKKLGIAAAQLRTSGIQINPEYQYPPNGRPILVGYRASNSIRVEIRSLPLVGGVIDGALAKGATRVDGLSFFASDTELATREADAATPVEAGTSNVTVSIEAKFRFEGGGGR